MTKSDIISVVANECDLSNAYAKYVVNVLFDAIKIELSKGGEVRIKDFGTFKTVVRKAKKARLIAKGATIVVPERNKVKFTASKNFKVD